MVLNNLSNNDILEIAKKQKRLDYANIVNLMGSPDKIFNKASDTLKQETFKNLYISAGLIKND